MILKVFCFVWLARLRARHCGLPLPDTRGPVSACPTCGDIQMPASSGFPSTFHLVVSVCIDNCLEPWLV